MPELLCAECGEALREGEACYFAGNAYCASCLDDLTVRCARCETRIYRYDACGKTAIDLWAIFRSMIFSSRLRVQHRPIFRQ